MQQQPHDRLSLWGAIDGAGNLSGRFLAGSGAAVTLGELERGSTLGGRAAELCGRAAVVATDDQLTAALALIELDGIARRLILYPPDLPLEHLPFVIASTGADAIVSNRNAAQLGTAAADVPVVCTSEIKVCDCDRTARHKTEWVLLTSGTTGRPKMLVHTLATLTGAIGEAALSSSVPSIVWSTFYDIRRYGGLQILLRALLTNASLVLSSAEESTEDFLIRVGARQVTHISGTPSHWRRALMSPAARRIQPPYIRLSGELADQNILDHLRSFYPEAMVAHAFASTEAGVAFEIRDGRAGFPASLTEGPQGDVEIKVEEGSLRIRSNRIALGYVGREGVPLAGADGFVDTGDMLELRGDRYYFVGRRDGSINVGGLKVNPEEVEAVINRHPQVWMSLVQTRKNPITGAVVVADVVLRQDSNGQQGPELKDEIFELCRRALPRHKVPARIRFVAELTVAASGKMARCHA